MKWVEWGILILAALWTLMTNLSVRERYKISSQPTIPANGFAMFQTVSVVGVSVLHYSPLHLFWLIPLAYVFGFVALRFKPFQILAWLYGYVLSYTIPSNW